jgi:hypothetical protein
MKQERPCFILHPSSFILFVAQKAKAIPAWMPSKRRVVRS